MVACYMLGPIKAEEIERMAASMRGPRTNRVYQAKHPKAMLPTRVVALKKTQKWNNASQDQGFEDEPSDQEAKEPTDMASEEQDPTTEEVTGTSSSMAAVRPALFFKQTGGSSAALYRVKRVKVRRSAVALPVLLEEDERVMGSDEEEEVEWVEDDSTAIPKRSATPPVMHVEAS